MALVGQLVTVLLRLGGFLVVVGGAVLLVAETIGRIILLVSQAVLFGTVVVLRHGHFTSFQLVYSYYSEIRTVYSMQ